MENILIEKFGSYLVANHPDLLVQLQESRSVTEYIQDKVLSVKPLLDQLLAEEKPAYIIEELCLAELTADLRPSKFHYIRQVLEEDFLQAYRGFEKMGVLTYEIINMIEVCKPVFERLGFTEESEDDRILKYVIIGSISEYLDR